MLRRAYLSFTFLILTAVRAAAGTELIMIEEHGCMYCERWNAEIAPIYPKTDEGMAAPLRRVDFRSTLPEDLLLKSRPRFTPTFILVNDGKEISRIEGYPGDEFFWFLLGKMLEMDTTERSGG